MSENTPVEYLFCPLRLQGGCLTIIINIILTSSAAWATPNNVFTKKLNISEGGWNTLFPVAVGVKAKHASLLRWSVRWETKLRAQFERGAFEALRLEGKASRSALSLTLFSNQSPTQIPRHADPRAFPPSYTFVPPRRRLSAVQHCAPASHAHTLQSVVGG